MNLLVKGKSGFEKLIAKLEAILCVKRVLILSYSGPHFPAFSCIRTEYGSILRISLYSVRMRENAGKMRNRITPNTDAFYTVIDSKN